MIIVRWQTRKSPWMIRRIMCRINTLLTLKLWRKSGKRPPKVVVTFCFGLHCQNHYRNPSFLEVLVTFETFCWRCQNLSYFSFCCIETMSILTLISKKNFILTIFWCFLFLEYWIKDRVTLTIFDSFIRGNVTGRNSKFDSEYFQALIEMNWKLSFGGSS